MPEKITSINTLIPIFTFFCFVILQNRDRSQLKWVKASGKVVSEITKCKHPMV